MTEQFQTIVDIVIYFCQLLTSLNHKTAFTVIPFSLREIYDNNFKASKEQVKFIYSFELVNCHLLAPTGALVVMMVYYISAQ